jgi:hypothetical protein
MQVNLRNLLRPDTRLFTSQLRKSAAVTSTDARSQQFPWPVWTDYYHCQIGKGLATEEAPNGRHYALTEIHSYKAARRPRGTMPTSAAARRSGPLQARHTGKTQRRQALVEVSKSPRRQG